MDLKSIQKELKKKNVSNGTNSNSNNNNNSSNNVTSPSSSQQQLMSSILTYGPKSRMTGRNRHATRGSEEEHIEWNVNHTNTNGRSRSKKPLNHSNQIPTSQQRNIHSSPSGSPSSKRAALALATPSWAVGLRSPIDKHIKRSRSHSEDNNNHDDNPFGPPPNTYGDRFDQYQADMQRRNDENNNYWLGNEDTWNQAVPANNNNDDYNPFLPIPPQIATSRYPNNTNNNNNRSNSNPRSNTSSAPTRSSLAKSKSNSHNNNINGNRKKSKSPSYQYHSNNYNHNHNQNNQNDNFTMTYPHNYNPHHSHSYNSHSHPNRNPFNANNTYDYHHHQHNNTQQSPFDREYNVQSHPIHSLTQSPGYMNPSSLHPYNNTHSANNPANSNHAPSPLLQKSLSPEEMASIDAQVARALQSMDLSKYVDQSTSAKSLNNNSTPKSRSFKANEYQNNHNIKIVTNLANNNSNNNNASTANINSTQPLPYHQSHHQYYYTEPTPAASSNNNNTLQLPNNNNDNIQEPSTPFDDDHHASTNNSNVNVSTTNTNTSEGNSSTIIHVDDPFNSSHSDNDAPNQSPKSVSFSSNLKTHHEYTIPTPTEYHSEDEDAKKAKLALENKNQAENTNTNNNDQLSNDDQQDASHYQYVYEPTVSNSTTTQVPSFSDSESSMSIISSSGTYIPPITSTNTKHPLAEQSNFHKSLFGVSAKPLYIQVLSVGIACVDVMLSCDKYPYEDSSIRLTHSPHEKRGGNAANLSATLAQLNLMKYNDHNKMEISLLTTLGSEKERNTGIIIEALENEGVDCNNLIIHPSHPSPISYIVNAHNNSTRTIMHYRGNLPEVSITDFHRCLSRIFTPPLHHHYTQPYNNNNNNQLLPDYMWLHFEGRNVEQIERMIQTIRGIRESNVSKQPSSLPNTNNNNNNDITSYNQVNPSNTNYLLSLEVEKPRPHIESLWPLVDVLFFSQEYANHYLSLGYENTDTNIHTTINIKHARSASNSPARKASPKRLADEEALSTAANFVKIVANKLSHVHVRPIIVCMWGSAGSVCLDYNNVLTYCPAGTSSHIYSTVGAGDSFIASYIFASMQGANPSECLVFASKIALLKISNKFNELPRASTSAAVAKLINDMKNQRNKFLKKQRSNNTN